MISAVNCVSTGFSGNLAMKHSTPTGVEMESVRESSESYGKRPVPKLSFKAQIRVGRARKRD